ncbi:toll/interleukin-1 receptor domain-containing protein [Methylosinus sp. H3A]|uniref:toll/interleukin-1 receptor domain-containing protein n=1 Tax=Methylosinus sp. H3A TaxID=2785786 RepID=UPI0018C27E2F|nr:toll/interleukin-1 receptor domain-containing protein [Methylosinus sp. H3A]
MRAFLSHSSANKNFVGEVFSLLGAAIAEYDERTFSVGGFNTEVIREAIGRSNLFVIFATRQSIDSGFVNYEINIANEYLASRRIRQILTFCLDGVKPNDLPESVQLVSAVRRAVSSGTAARLIRSLLIELQISISQIPTPYLGREAITADIKRRLAAPDEHTPIAIAFSGMDGIGRRTLASPYYSRCLPRGTKSSSNNRNRTKF